jgi:hypothetical protein
MRACCCQSGLERPPRQRFRRLNIPRQSEALQQADEVPAYIGLIFIKADARRSGVGVMIIVPRLAHCRDRGPGDVVSLDARLIDQPALWPASVRKVTNEPVSVNRNRNARADTPKDVADAATSIESQCNWKLLGHPGFVEEAVNGVRANPAQIEARSASKFQAAVKLPPRIAQNTAAVSEIIVAVRLALRPVPQIVCSDHPERAAHADRSPEPREDALQQYRALETAVDHSPMEADRVTEQ